MIYALPGMGADNRVFPGAWQELADMKFVEWAPYVSAQNIPELAKAIANEEGIDDGDSIIGTSLGGMVACEISKIRSIDRLVLVGSAVSKEEISGLLALLRPLVPLAPVRIVKALSSSVPGDLARMFEGADAGFISAMCAAIFLWEGLGASPPGLIRIHGRHDLVIPHPGLADLTLDGGHLIAMTHAEECVAFMGRTAPGVFRPRGSSPSP